MENLIIHEVAVADRPGVAYFTAGKKSGQGTVHLSEQGESVYEVKIDKLDNFEFSKIDFIKIDAEGHDIDIIKGAKALIERDHPVMLIEMWKASDYREGLSRQEAIEFVEALGYKGAYPEGTMKQDILFVPVSPSK